MKANKVKVIVPHELLNQYIIVRIITSPMRPAFGLLIMGEDFNEHSSCNTLRFFLIEKEDDHYVTRQEINSISFGSYNEAQQFLDSLPELPAIELLILMGLIEIPVELIAKHIVQ